MIVSPAGFVIEAGAVPVFGAGLVDGVQLIDCANEFGMNSQNTKGMSTACFENRARRINLDIVKPT